MTLRSLKRSACRVFLGAIICLGTEAAHAGPWAEVGDSDLRSNFALLSAASLIDPLTNQWPVPWALGLPSADTSFDTFEYLRDVSVIVRRQGLAETRQGMGATLSADISTSPAVVRGFDGLARQTAQSRIALDYFGDSTAIRLSGGIRASSSNDLRLVTLDGSYIAQRFHDIAIYAGYIDHWWGPGWFTALGLSNNASPMPQIGLTRLSSEPFDVELLRLLGPWRAELIMGVLDGPRIARNTVYIAGRMTFNPIPHLEIGLSRTTQMCGSGHSCSAAGYFDLKNEVGSVNETNDQGTIDVRYSRAFLHWSYEVYGQVMNEDSHPLIHSVTSHLVGSSVWLPTRKGMARITAEYASSIASTNLFGGGVIHGASYNNYAYQDGMRYRGRTLGFSLDSDSELFSLQAQFADRKEHSVAFTYHRANVNSPQNTRPNLVSSVPAELNIGEVRLGLPIWLGGAPARMVVLARLQDNQPFPRTGLLPSAEMALTLPF